MFENQARQGPYSLSSCRNKKDEDASCMICNQSAWENETKNQVV
mgnify:FL=1